MWEWDLPKKKGDKKKKGKKAATTSGKKAEAKEVVDEGVSIEVAGDESPESSRPGSRSARVEDVPDEDI